MTSTSQITVKSKQPPKPSSHHRQSKPIHRKTTEKQSLPIDVSLPNCFKSPSLPPHDKEIQSVIMTLISQPRSLSPLSRCTLVVEFFLCFHSSRQINQKSLQSLIHATQFHASTNCLVFIIPLTRTCPILSQSRPGNNPKSKTIQPDPTYSQRPPRVTPLLHPTPHPTPSPLDGTRSPRA